VSRLQPLFEDIVELNNKDDRVISTLELDSRKVSPGTLFLSVTYKSTDGREMDYIIQAVKKGAAAVAYEKRQTDIQLDNNSAVPLIAVDNLHAKIGVIASRYYGQPSKRLQLIGVTGTNGKTTFIYLLTQAFELLGKKCGMMGTIGNGYINNLKKTMLTTENAVDIQRKLSNFLDAKVNTVCMEVSSHGLEQNRVSELDFDIAVFTNLSHDHLDYHETLEQYVAAKKKLFQFPNLDMIIVNRDDLVGRQILENHRAKKSITYGMEQGDIFPRNLKVDEKGIEFSVRWNNMTVTLCSPLLGEINVSNLLAVVACLLGSGVVLTQIEAIIPQLFPPPGRMEVFRGPGDTPKVIVDYSHTPDALKSALLSIIKLKQGKLIVVFGCGGDRDSGKRPQMGRIAEQYADMVIITDDNPRSESPKEIIRQIQAGMSYPAKVIHDRRTAIQEAIRLSSVHDIVLVAGKGHEDTQITNHGVFDLSDRDVVEKTLKVMS